MYVFTFCLRNWWADFDGTCFCIVKIVLFRYNVDAYLSINNLPSLILHETKN
jgi:hypothetical protein